MDKSKWQMAVLVVARVDTQQLDNGFKRFVTDLDVLTRCDFRVFEEVARRTMKNYHGGMIKHV